MTPQEAKAWLVIWEDPYIDNDDMVWSEVEDKPDRGLNFTLAWTLREYPDRLVLCGCFGVWESEPGKITDTGHRTVVPKSCVIKKIALDITPDMFQYKEVT